MAFLLPTPSPKQKQLGEKGRPGDLIPFASEQRRELWGWLVLGSGLDGLPAFLS